MGEILLILADYYGEEKEYRLFASQINNYVLSSKDSLLSCTQDTHLGE